MFRRCPSCKKLFEAVEIKRDVLGANEFEEEGGRSGVKVGHVENIRVTFKCKNCDYKWTNIEQKTF